MQFGFAVPPAEEEAKAIRVRVEVHALTLKIGLVNAIRTDTDNADPVTRQAMADIRQRYADIIAEVSAKQVLGDPISQDELGAVSLIKTGFAYFKAVDAALALILEEGNVADPLANDPRWPAPPS